MKSSTRSELRLSGVRFGYPRQPAFLGPIDAAIESGQFWAIVGPNGAGKSTLIRLMAGLLRPVTGSVAINNRPLSRLSLRERALRIGFLPQRAPDSTDLSVRDLVLMGRYPHRSMGLFESSQDHRIALRAMEQTEIAELADRPISTLSGGEAQRAHLAAVFAQEPQLLLLDEPTASLDIAHQLSAFEILRRASKPGGPAVVTVTHDVNLALSYCSHALLLHQGSVAASGTPADVLNPSRLQGVYGVEFEQFMRHGSGRPWIVPSSNEMAGSA